MTVFCPCPPPPTCTLIAVTHSLLPLLLLLLVVPPSPPLPIRPSLLLRIPARCCFCCYCCCPRRSYRCHYRRRSHSTFLALRYSDEPKKEGCLIARLIVCGGEQHNAAVFRLRACCAILWTVALGIQKAPSRALRVAAGVAFCDGYGVFQSSQHVFAPQFRKGYMYSALGTQAK